MQPVKCERKRFGFRMFTDLKTKTVSSRGPVASHGAWSSPLFELTLFDIQHIECYCILSVVSVIPITYSLLPLASSLHSCSLSLFSIENNDPAFTFITLFVEDSF